MDFPCHPCWHWRCGNPLLLLPCAEIIGKHHQLWLWIFLLKIIKLGFFKNKDYYSLFLMLEFLLLWLWPKASWERNDLFGLSFPIVIQNWKKSGKERKWGRNQEVGANTEAMEKDWLIAFSPKFSHSAFLHKQGSPAQG